MRKFTKQQVDFICDQIGEWYVQWENQLVDYETRTHRLGFAKEELKARICGEEYKDLEDEYDINLKANPWETEPDAELLEKIDQEAVKDLRTRKAQVLYIIREHFNKQEEK